MYPCLTFQHVLQIVPPPDSSPYIGEKARRLRPKPKRVVINIIRICVTRHVLLLQIITLSYLTPGDADLFTTRVPTFLTFLTSAIIDIRWIPDDPYA
jgi:hypothetical protein